MDQLTQAVIQVVLNQPHYRVGYVQTYDETGGNPVIRLYYDAQLNNSISHRLESKRLDDPNYLTELADTFNALLAPKAITTTGKLTVVEFYRY